MAEEYLTESETARRLCMSVSTLRRKKDTVFKRGVHYFTPGWTRPRWKWSAVREKWPPTLLAARLNPRS